jgi:hypothetical protein
MILSRDRRVIVQAFVLQGLAVWVGRIQLPQLAVDDVGDTTGDNPAQFDPPGRG